MKILPFGVAVIEDDTHISKWVEQHGRLNIAEEMLAPFLKYVAPGSIVIDAGAMIGDHTVTYSEWVGERGRVIAFEPNPAAYECLIHNTSGMANVGCYRAGLSDADGETAMHVDKNAGRSHLGDGDGDRVLLMTLDSLELSDVSFIKIDVEGFESRVIAGAKDTIMNNRPAMLIEVNEGALRRAGSSREWLVDLIRGMEYKTELTDKRHSWNDLQYDVICLPAEGVK